MNIVALVGSLRKDSFNLNLVKTMQERYNEKLEIKIADIDGLPYFNQDDENNPSKVVTAFKRQIANADGILIATPEYNWSIPSVLKNALDWLSRVDKVLINKPVMIVGASTGMAGTLRAQIHLRQILSSTGLSARVLPPGGNEVLINFADQKFSNGKLVDEPTLIFMDQITDKFIDWIMMPA
jgi:chromate reductase